MGTRRTSARRLRTTAALTVAAFVLAGNGYAQEPAARGPAARPALLLQNAHADEVTVVAFRPDAMIVASGSGDLTVKIWETATGAMLRTLTGHSQRIRAVVFTPDGRRLLSSGDDQQLMMWDPSSGRLLASLRTAGAVVSMAVARGGATLAAADADSTTLFDIRGDTLVRRAVLAGVSGALAFSADGLHLAATADGGGVWDVLTGRRIYRLEGKPRCLVIPDDSTLILAGDEVAVYSAATGQARARHAINVGERCSISGDGRWVAGMGSDHRIRRWRLGTSATEFESLAGHEGRFGWVLHLEWAPDNTTLASTGEDRAIKLWDAESGRLVRTMTGHADAVESLAFHPGGRQLATGGLGPSGDIQFWELASGAPGRRITGRPRPLTRTPGSAGERQALQNLEELGQKVAALGGTVTGISTTWEGGRRPGGGALDLVMAGLELNLRPLAFAPDGSRLASGSLSRYLDLWDPARGERLRTLTAHLGTVRAVAFAPDGRVFATGGEDRIIKVWDAGTSYIRHEFVDAHTGMIRSLAFSPDGSTLASSSFGDHTVKVWSLSTGALRTSVTPDGRTFFLGFSRDGRSLVTCGNRFEMWDAANGRRQERGELVDQAGGVVACSLSPDRTIAAFGEHRGVIRLVDLGTGRERHVLSGHDGSIWSLAFNPTGTILIASSADSRMTVWDVATGTLLATALSLRNGEDWLVAAPDGLFDGSPGGWQLLRWRFSESLMDTAPAEAFFNEFYHPGLLAELMDGQRPSAPREMGQVDRRPVAVSLEVVSQTAAARTGASTREVEVRVRTVEASATNGHQPAGSGARDVRLFRNGSLVAAWRGDVLRGERAATLSARVPLVAGENRFTAYGFNRDDVRGPIAELTVRGDSALRRKGTLYLVAIGINRYANTDFNLSYAVPDAELFLQQMAAQQGALAGFESVKVIGLYNEEATRRNILAALDRLAGKTTMSSAPFPPAIAGLTASQPEDAVFVFYAGHGTRFERSFYLIPHDLGYAGNRDAMTSAEAKAMLTHGISDRDLEAAFEKIDAARILLIVDACNSGQVLESEEARRGPMNSKGLAQLAYEKGMYVLTASQGYQAALEASQLGHGLLTFVLVEDGLQSGNADHAPKDGSILLREWLDFTSLRVPQMQQQLMQDAGKAGRALAFVIGEEKLARVEDRSLQRPRVYYRREAELVPFVVAKPGSR